MLNKHCLEYVYIYKHQCLITSETEKDFKGTLRALRKKKKDKEKLLAMFVQGDPVADEGVQKIIDDVIKQRERRVQEKKDINNRVITIEEIKTRRDEETLNDLRGVAMEHMIEDGLELDEITLEMVDERVNAIQEKQDERVLEKELSKVTVFVDVECIRDSTNTFVPILICYAREDEDPFLHHYGTNCIQAFIKTMLKWTSQDDKEEQTKTLHIFLHNLKGFDGIFMIDALYKMNLKVKDIMGTNKNTVFQTPEFAVQRFTVISQHVIDKFHKYLWLRRVKERLVFA